MEKKNISATFRLPAKEYKILKKFADSEKISLNTLVNHIISKFLEWDIAATKAGWTVVHRNTMREILQCIDENKLKEIAEHSAEYMKDVTLLMSGSTNLESCLEMLRNRAKNSGFVVMESEHENDKKIIFQHDMGRK